MLRAASGGITRRLVQTAVVLVVLTASTAAAMLGVTLLTNANELFYSAVAAQHGADLAVTFNAARVTRRSWPRPGGAAGVTQAAGPYPEARRHLSAGRARPVRRRRAVHARAERGGPGVSASGPLDDLTLNQGQWATLPGQIDLAIYQPLPSRSAAR